MARGASRDPQQPGPGYSAAVLDHYRNPRNPGRLPRDAPDVGTGEAGEPEEGDLVRIQLRADARGRVHDVRFQAFGCTATIASASLATELARGRELAELAAVTADELARRLSLAPERARSAGLAAAALARAARALAASCAPTGRA